MQPVVEGDAERRDIVRAAASDAERDPTEIASPLRRRIEGAVRLVVLVGHFAALDAHHRGDGGRFGAPPYRRQLGGVTAELGEAIDSAHRDVVPEPRSPVDRILAHLLDCRSDHIR